MNSKDMLQLYTHYMENSLILYAYKNVIHDINTSTVQKKKKMKK